MAAENIAEKRVPLGNNTAGCNFSLRGSDGNVEKARAPIDGAVGKRAEVRDVRAVGPPGTVKVNVKTAIASDAFREFVVVHFLSANVAERTQKQICR
eukprot:2263482-Pleurochrysis_carterae.AAC.5